MKPDGDARPCFGDLEHIFYSEVHGICQKWAHYFEIYERHLSRFRGSKVRLLEIGVSQGGSLDIWRRFFGQEAELIGVDIDPLCRRFEAPNTRIVIGDQGDRAFVAALAADLEAVDVIIDDGGHTMMQQKTTFELLFPIVREAGIYICEDCHTSYQAAYGGGLRLEDSFIEAMKHHIDGLHSLHPGGPLPSALSATIGCLSFYDSVVVIERRSKIHPRPVELGREIDEATRVLMASLHSEALKPAIACLSLAKTSSTSLTEALRRAGFDTARHLHYFGPRSIAFKEAEQRALSEGPEPMLAVASNFAALLQNPKQKFRIVTCLRDPIARLVALAFEGLPLIQANTGLDVTQDPAQFIDWVDKRFKGDITTAWFDDSFQTTFGLDFRRQPFDFDRKSLRFCTEQLRLVVLRVEDPATQKEAELGWLMERDSISIPTVNVGETKSYAAAYRAFAEAFVAPESWLTDFYESDIARHFYTPSERDALRCRWSAPPNRRTKASNLLREAGLGR